MKSILKGPYELQYYQLNPELKILKDLVHEAKFITLSVEFSCKPEPVPYLNFR
jgi:hypothetical protein